MQNQECRIQNPFAILHCALCIPHSEEFDLYHLPKSVSAHCKTELCDKRRAYPPLFLISCETRSSFEPLKERGSTSEVRFFTSDPWFLLRKEAIHPQVPLRLPCYDFIPITIHTFGICLLAVNPKTSGTNGVHHMTAALPHPRSPIHVPRSD